jgi:transcriptional regulator with XRE-family HTH domain
VTQSELAERLGWEQARVSRFERQTDWKLSTLAEYLAALGLEADLVLRLPNNKKITQHLTEGDK